MRIMPARCKFCLSPRRSEFETKLAKGTITQTQISTIIGCDQASVTRHVQHHLTKKIVKAADAASRVVTAATPTAT